MRRIHSLSPLILAAALAGCQADAQAPVTDRGTSGDRSLAPVASGGVQKADPSGDRRPSEPPEAAPAGAGGGETRRAEAPQPVTLPKGTALPLVFQTAVSSANSRSGDLVVAKLASEVRAGGKVVLPARAELRGRVVTAVPSGRVKGRARLAVSFDRVVVDGVERLIETSTIDVTAEGTGKRDAKIIGGSTGAGVVIGAIAGGKKGAVVGGVVGAGAGTGAVLATKGKEVSFPAGYRRTIRLTEALTLG
jgi:hypothetical protein